MEDIFHFRKFSVLNGESGQKVGTDGVLLGAAADLSFLQENVPDIGDNVSQPFLHGGMPDNGVTGEEAGRRRNPARILDIGTGTGLIALMLAQRLEQAQRMAEITAIEIDTEAAGRARRNFEASPWSSMLQCLPISLESYADSLYCDPGIDVESASGAPQAAGRFELIVSNPPFYDNYLQSPDSARATARSTGSLSYREIITFASDFLAPEGRLALILPKDEQQRLVRFAASFGLFPQSILSIRTTAAKTPKRIIAEFSRTKGKTADRTLTMQEADGSFTEEYLALTADFYLRVASPRSSSR